MKLKYALNTEKGSSIILFAAAMTLIMGCAAVSVDLGLSFNEKSQLSNAADAAALAGAQELANNTGNTATAVAVAEEYLDKNGEDSCEYEIKVLDGNKSVSVEAKKEVPHYFARVFGLNNGEVSARATAAVFPVSEAKSGVRPFAVPEQTLTYGKSYILKEGAGGGNSGNYGLLALGGNGSNVLRKNIVDGYNQGLKVGDYVDTEPGNKKGPVESSVQSLIDGCTHTPKCTYKDYEPDCPRVITVVIVDSLSVCGRKPVKVEGFASFFLEDVDEDCGGSTQIKGRFIKNVVAGNEVGYDQKDYGLEGIKLIQ